MDVQQIIIVTQTPPPPPAVLRKHPGGDRTGQSHNRSKLTVDIAQAINDGLYFYEQVNLWIGVAGHAWLHVGGPGAAWCAH